MSTQTIVKRAEKKISVSDAIGEWRKKYGSKLKSWNDVLEIRRWRERETLRLDASRAKR